MWYMIVGEPCEMKKQRIDSKLDRKILLKESAKGLTQAQIARKYQVRPQAVSQQFKRIINQDAVDLYDNHLPAILKTAAITHISDSLNDAKRKKSSAFQSATAGGICLTHLQGLPKTQINIQIIQERMQQSQSERERLVQELEQLRAGDEPLNNGNGNECIKL
jgi:3-keto-L-gulonate-6-phosphate decarboxylase